MQPVDLAQAAAQPVAVHGMAELCPDREADPVFRAAVFAAVEHQTGVGAGRTLAVETAEDVIEFEGFGKLHSCASSGSEP